EPDPTACRTPGSRARSRAPARPPRPPTRSPAARPASRRATAVAALRSANSTPGNELPDRAPVDTRRPPRGHGWTHDYGGVTRSGDLQSSAEGQLRNHCAVVQTLD